MILPLRTLPCDERLTRLNLFTLKKKCLQGDTIQVFKYMKGFSNVNHSKLFELQTNSRTRNSFSNVAYLNTAG